MKVKIINKSDNPLPEYKTLGSAGVDIYSSEHTVVYGGSNAVIGTGLFMAIPVGYEIQIRPRSGLAAKYIITVLNTPGTIDSDYREEVGVILINHSRNDFIINKGDRIAQMVFKQVEQIEWEQVEELDETDRKGGYGSTGK